MSKHFAIGVTLAVLCLVLVGCGGGGGEPSVSQATHDLLQHELDTALEELEAEKTARQAANRERTRLAGELQTASGRVTALEAQIGAATDTANSAATASLHAQLNAAKAQVTTLTAQIGAATDTPSASTTASLHAQLNAARNQVAALTDRIGAATDAASASTSASLHAQLNAAKAQVTDLQRRLGIATTAQQEAEAAQQQAEQEAQQAQQEAQQQIEEAQRQAALSQRVSGLLTALGADDLSTEHEEAGVTVEHMRGATGGRKVEPNDFYARGSAAPGISGWQSASFTRETSANVDTLYLYTNIQSPNTRPFWKVHGISAVGMTATLQTIAAGGRAVPNADTNSDNSDGHQYDELTISGSLGATGGTFTCATACTGTVGGDTDDVDSHVTFTGGKPVFDDATEWTFTPTSVTAAHQRPQDETYLYFGIWARHPKTATGTPDFKWIAGGGAQGIGRTPAALTDANFEALTGTATFTGGAVGQYAIDKTSVGGQTSSGTFTAKATLRAKFDAPRQLSGQITEFRAGGTSLAGWNVYLQGSDSDTPATLVAAGTTGTTVASGTIDGVSATGTWAARLYGVDNMAPPAGTQCPNGCRADVAGVTGWFNADSDPAGIVAIAGAFGASK